MTLNSLLLVYILTIVLVRVVLCFFPKHAPTIGGFQMHHYMHGLGLIVLYFFIPWPVLLAVGLALVVDEVPLFFMFKGWNWPDNHWKQYHSWQSVVWIVVITLCIDVVITYMLY